MVAAWHATVVLVVLATLPLILARAHVVEEDQWAGPSALAGHVDGVQVSLGWIYNHTGAVDFEVVANNETVLAPRVERVGEGEWHAEFALEPGTFAVSVCARRRDVPANETLPDSAVCCALRGALVVLGAPTQLRAEALNGHEMEVTWGAGAHWGGLDVVVDVRVYMTVGNDVVCEGVTSNATFVCDGLQRRGTYSVEVAGGLGNVSRSTVARTDTPILMPDVPEAVSDVRIVEIAHDAVSLEWDEPEAWGWDVTLYQLQVQALAGGGRTEWDTQWEGGDLEATCTGLESESSYVFRVRAQNGLGWGTFGESIQAVTWKACTGPDGGCGENGACNEKGLCDCEVGWYGEDCSTTSIDRGNKDAQKILLFLFVSLVSMASVFVVAKFIIHRMRKRKGDKWTRLDYQFEMAE